MTNLDRKTKLVILTAALGYFVDVFDLVLFSIVRVSSLKDLGLTGDDLLNVGVNLLNMQLIGLIVGGIFWGILGDKKGRVSVLFGSIITYSLANILNGFVTSVEAYSLLRFVAGVGLAGELGAGITLVSEILSKEKRGWGTTIVATVGVSGAIVAGLVGDLMTWRSAYIIGGVGGLFLLALRFAVHESGMFEAVKNQNHVRGDFWMLFNSRTRFFRFINCILTGMPVWFFAGILMTFAPEIGVALGVTEKIVGAKTVIASYIGLTVGDLASGLFCQLLKSRKKVLKLFIISIAILSGYLLLSPTSTSLGFYIKIGIVGFFAGYWAVLVSTAAEQFGTNMRATVATSVPNFIRGSAVPMTLLFKGLIPQIGTINSAISVGILATVLAMVGVSQLQESFGRDLGFVEE